MRKDIPSKENEKERAIETLQAIGKMIHERHEFAQGEVERLDATEYINEDNVVDIEALNKSDAVGVEEVLAIGSLLAMNYIHNSLHDIDHAINHEDDLPEGIDKALDALREILGEQVEVEVINIKKKEK